MGGGFESSESFSFRPLEVGTVRYKFDSVIAQHRNSDTAIVVGKGSYNLEVAPPPSALRRSLCSFKNCFLSSWIRWSGPQLEFCFLNLILTLPVFGMCVK